MTEEQANLLLDFATYIAQGQYDRASDEVHTQKAKEHLINYFRDVHYMDDHTINRLLKLK
jgi:hypothetical protein